MSSLPLGSASSKLQPINKTPVVLDVEKRNMQVSASAKSAKSAKTVDDTGVEFRTANKVHTVCRGSASQLARSFFMGERDELPVDSDTLPAFVRENDTTLTFPERLMLLLAYVEKSNKYTKDHPPPISWMSDGQSFVIRDRHALTNDFLYLFFGPCKFASFCRKLHRWGFCRRHSPPNEDDFMVYGNDHFQRDKRNLMAHMTNSATAIARHRRALKKQEQQQHQLQRCNGVVGRQEVKSIEQGQAPTAKITQSGRSQEELETSQDECALHSSSDFATGEEREAGLEKSCCTLLDTRKVSDGKPTKAPSPAVKDQDSIFPAPPVQSEEVLETGKAVFRTANNVRVVARGSASLLAGPFLHGIEDKLQLDNDDLPDFVRRHSTTLSFPQRLMLMMTYVDRRHEPDPPISWILDGTAIIIHNSDALTESILHLFFGPCKFGSFTRKLYRWGFRQVRAMGEEGSKSGELAFANDFFQRDNKQLMVNMKSMTAVGRKRAIEKKLKLENSFQGNRGSYLSDGRKEYQQPPGEDSDSATSHPKEPDYLNDTAFGHNDDTTESDQQECENDGLFPSLKRWAADHNELPGAAKRRCLMSRDSMLPRQSSGDNSLSTELNPSARQLAVGGTPLLQDHASSRDFLLQASQPNILFSAQQQLLLQQRGLLQHGGFSMLPSSSLSDLHSIQHLQNLQSIHQLQTLQQQQSLVVDRIRMQERERLLMELRMGAQNQLPTSHTANYLLSSIALGGGPIPMGAISLQGPPFAQQATNPGDPFFIL